MFVSRITKKIPSVSRTLVRRAELQFFRPFSAFIPASTTYAKTFTLGKRFESTDPSIHGKKPGAFEYYSRIAKNIATEGVTVLSGPIRVYKKMVKDGDLVKDPYQMATIRLLQHLYEKIETFYGGIDYDRIPENKDESIIPTDRVCEDDPEDQYENQGKPQWLLDLFYHHDKSEGETCVVKTIRAPKGTYIFGVHGSGKSIMTDILYDCIDRDIPKEKVAFNEFISEVQNAVHRYKGDTNDAITAVARDISANAKVLFFDDFDVKEKEVALMVQKLFTELFLRDVCIIITSEYNPDDLYKNGEEREKFLPFIDLVKHQCPGIYINSNKDYRFGGKKNAKTFYTPVCKENDEKINALLSHINHGNVIQWQQSSIKSAQNKKLVVPFSDKGICQFLFNNICSNDMTIGDYISICNNYHTLVLKNIPQMDNSDLDHLKKFILLIDELYEHKVKLICTSDVSMDKLFITNDTTPKDDILAFNRTLKRLQEMQTRSYLQKLHPLQKKKLFDFSF